MSDGRFDFWNNALSSFLTHRTRGWCPLKKSHFKAGKGRQAEHGTSRARRRLNLVYYANNCPARIRPKEAEQRRKSGTYDRMFPPAFNCRDLPRFADTGRDKTTAVLRCRGVAGALRWRCDLVCQCVATKCVAALPPPLSFAVEKFLNPVRRRASGSKKERICALKPSL